MTILVSTYALPAVQFWVPGKPRGKDRPRHRPNGRPYTTHQTVHAEQSITQEWWANGAIRLPDGPVCIHVKVCVERPQSHLNTRGDLNASGVRMGLPYKQKPDVDNVLKLVMDALNGHAYRDDVQVVETHLNRIWAADQGLLIALKSLPREAK